MNINFEKVKELFAKIKFEKGKIKQVIALVTLTGTLLSKNPVQNNNGNTIVYAKETLDDVKDENANFSLDTANEEKVELTLEEAKKNAVKDLKSVYKTYLKKYYTSKAYKELTSKYKKGVKVINACKTNEKVEEYYGRYEATLKAIKPSKLVSYQKKLETSFLKTYKKLIENNEYSDNNLAKLEDIKNEGIESIYGALTKTKSKKAKTNYVKELTTVKTLVAETKDYVISYINDSKDLNEDEKEAIINQINNLDNIEDINSVGEEYGYVEEEEYVETNPNKMTLDILNDKDKLKEFAEKYEEKLDDSNYPGYFMDSNGVSRTTSYKSLTMAIYSINYTYVDPSVTRQAYLEFYPPEMGYPKEMVEFAIGSQRLVREYGYKIDYNSLIIENNKLKGVGDLINKLEDIYLNYEKKGKSFNKYLKEYIDNYMGENMMLDAIVYKIAFSVSQMQYSEDKESSCFVIYDKETKYLSNQNLMVYVNLYDEYFYTKEKEKTKK